MTKPLFSFLALCLVTGPVTADLTTLVDESVIQAIAKESSGVSAKRNLDEITLFHRTRASSQFRQASEHVLRQLRAYGFDEAEILEFPADGKTLFGTQKARTAWDVAFAELWELDADGNRVTRHGSWEAMPLSVAQDSVSGKATAALVDIGAGTAEADYAGKDLLGKFVLTGSQPSAVVERAVGDLGAAGIISYAPNQKSAWWKEDDRLVRWGHLETFAKTPSFAFMISLGEARALRERLQAGEEIMFDGEVRASQEVGRYALVTATIAGADPVVGGEEIIYSCHLDHPRPGANDNVSGCVSILEAARTLRRLLDLGVLPAPRRTLRFVWPAEIEGSIIYLASLGDTSHIKSNIHLDMVGGGEKTKSIFRISGGPMSLPSFVSDAGHEIGHFVNRQTERHASGLAADFPLVSPEGSRNAQLALMEGISLGSDHQVFNEGSWRIPGIYLHDWPDRYIHTNFDTAAMIDPTKLRRAAFIAAVQGWYLANFDSNDVEPALLLLRANALERARQTSLALRSLYVADVHPVLGVHWQVERAKIASIGEFAALSKAQLTTADAYIDGLARLISPGVMAAIARVEDQRVFQRNTDIKGPMHGFGFSFLEDRLGVQETAALALTGAKAYEALNLVNGKRTVSGIRDWLLAEFGGEISLTDLAAYLEALEKDRRGT